MGWGQSWTTCPGLPQWKQVGRSLPYLLAASMSMGTGLPGVGATCAKRDGRFWRLRNGVAQLSTAGRVTVLTEKGFGWRAEVWAERKVAFAAWF